MRMPDAQQRARQVISRSLGKVRQWPLPLALTLLGYTVVAELESAYDAGWNAAVTAMQSRHDKGG